MGFRYNSLQRKLKKIFRKFFPIQKSSYTTGYVKDICAVHLVPPKKLKRFFLKSIKTLRTLKGGEVGDYLEFGVFNGTSMICMMQACRELGIKKTKIIGFDSFQGLPEGKTNEDDGVWSKGMYNCSFKDLKKCLVRKNINLKEITFVKGWYKDTLNEKTRKKLKLKNIGIIFIDCDTYQSSKIVLEFISPLLTKETIVCFDDWKLNDLDIKGMGEYKAFNEFIENNKHITVKSIKSYNRKSRSFLITPKLND